MTHAAHADACAWCAGYETALRDVAGWIDDDIADGVFTDQSEDAGNNAARSIAARLREQASRADLERLGTR